MAKKNDIVKGLEQFEQKIIGAFNTSEETNTSTLLTPEFISTNSSFKNLDELLKASPLEINTQEDFDNLKDNKIMDEFISKNTKFENFEHMIGTAFIEKQLKNL